MTVDKKKSKNLKNKHNINDLTKKVEITHINNNTTRILPIVPKKVGSLSLKLVKKDYQIVNSNNEIVGMLTTPKQLRTYYIPCWSVWVGSGSNDVLIDCFVELSTALISIQKHLNNKKSLKKKKKE
jgi:hypothetical protein